MIEITESILDTSKVINSVMDAGCGGLNVFIGNVRNNTKGKKVIYLEFEAYYEMAINELQKIVNEAKSVFNVSKMAIVHRTGKVEIGEAAVVIAVAAPHRDAAFKACRFAIDTLKQTVPIWKKEVFEDGEVWVSAHP